MGEPLHSLYRSAAAPDAATAATNAAALPLDAPHDSRPQYVPYRPAGSDFTPPASPRPMSPFAFSPSVFASPKAKQRPTPLQLDATPTPPAYERPTYSPSPLASPTLPPAAPSPHFPRPRGLSLLRQASSPLNGGFPKAEQPLSSPTFAPTMRHVSGAGPTSDPRSMFNPLASNPPNQSGPLWRNSREDLDIPPMPIVRPRGMTSSSQPAHGSRPLLRAATSIPDYDQRRASGKANPSSAYRPDRGGANWSHNDHFPLPSLPSESRASYRSAWTHASSVVDASGTERSSIITRRSSLSDQRASVSSLAPSEPDTQADTDQQTQSSNVEDEYMSVEDVIDSYCYGDDDEDDVVSPDSLSEEISRVSSSLTGASDSELPGLSQTNSQNSQSDQGSAHLTPEPFASLATSQPADRPFSFMPLNDMPDDNECVSPKHQRAKSSQNGPLPTLRVSPVKINGTSAESPSMSGTNTPVQEFQAANGDPKRQLFGEIYHDLGKLPVFPKEKSRLSRQDWEEIQEYARKHSRGSSQMLSQFGDASPRPAPAQPAPNQEPSSPLPEVDEDDAYPRRASTSVFDRRSTFLDLSRAMTCSPPQPQYEERTKDFGPTLHTTATGKRESGQTLASSPVSPVSATSASSFSSRKPNYAPRKPVERDRYGFKKATDKISARDYDAWYNNYEAYVARRRGKWIAMMERQNLPTQDPVRFPPHCEKVRRYVRKGYPPEWRGAMWWFYSRGQKKLDQMPGLYASLVARIERGELNKDDAEAIERDLDRTFPDNIHFRPDTAPEGLDGSPEMEPVIVRDLRQVLQCFALNNPGIGYCQSLNFIAGLLLLFMNRDVEKVFVLLTIITQYHLPGAHARSLANTEVNVLMMLIKDYLPKVWASINDTDLINNGLGSHAHPDSKYQRQPTVALSCTSWFMSLFVGVLPIEVVLRVWDAFLYEGPRALFRYALAIFKLGEPEIRKFHPGDGELFMTVQNLPRTCLDPNALHDIAYVKRGFNSLSQGVVDQKRIFWQQQIARDRSKRSKKSNDMPFKQPPRAKDPFLAVISEATADEDRKRSHGLRRRASASRRFFKRLDLA